MVLYNSQQEYLYNLHTCTSSEARRLWRQTIREKWDYKCAYCGSDQELTIDHVIPQSKGGSDFTTNVICCCRSCNQSKSHLPWQEWYKNQEFFSEKNRKKIIEWTSGEQAKPDLYSYGRRRNNAS